MKLHELITALADEIERLRPELEHALAVLAACEADDPAFLDALDHYSDQARRLGEAVEMAGFPGLRSVCNHVLDNILMVPAYARAERAPVLEFLRTWPTLMVHHLRHIEDPSSAAGLIDGLRAAPVPLGEDEGLRIMHRLGAMPQLALAAGDGRDPQQSRPVIATPRDVELIMPADVDAGLLDGFLQEAPAQAAHLVRLARNMAAGEGDMSDVVAAKRISHTLKGSGATIGLRGLAALSHHYEDILEHFEGQGGRVSRPVADILLDAAYCLEQMVDHLLGQDEAPAHAQAVLQNVLDLANRIDRGEAVDEPLHRHGASVPASAFDALDEAPAPLTDTAGRWTQVASPKLWHMRPSVPDDAGHTTPGGAAAPTGAGLRIGMARIDELLRVSGEVTVHAAAMEARTKALTERAADLMRQNLRLQKRLFEIETLVDVRALSLMRARAHPDAAARFDPLELDQYTELHSSTHALVEEAADARMLAGRLAEGVAELGGLQTRQRTLARDLQHLVMSTRMAEVSTLEPRLRRNVRATCQATGKVAELDLIGAGTLMDSEVLNHLGEPLLHIIRNAIDHGIESPADRLARGKTAVGRLVLEFTRQGQQVVLRCKDDGAGLDLALIRQRAVDRGLIAPGDELSEDETARLILLPGFSTRDKVSEVSGRGVGLDVVREWVSAMNGAIRIQSRQGQGMLLELRFAASLVTVQSLVVGSGVHRLALPSVQVERAVPRGVGRFERLAGRLLYHHDGATMPASLLNERVGLPTDSVRALDDYDAVLVRINDRSHALAVESLIDARELLVKSPGRYVRHLRGVAGLSMLGDGSIAVNLDLLQLLGAAPARSPPPVSTSPGALSASRARVVTVLIVDDALSVRNALQQLVEDAGYKAETARDGADALQRLEALRPDLILTDLEMPTMNGVELTRHIRAHPKLARVPIIMITSRSQDKHRRLADEAGVDVYLTKPYNGDSLLDTLKSLLKRSAQSAEALA